MLAVCATSVSCNSSKHAGKKGGMPGTWQATPIVIDADSKDWPSPYPNYDSKALIGYATSNDKRYLYITMETGDENTEMKVLKEGVTVIIDTTGGKEQTLAIHYPLPDESEEPFEVDNNRKTAYSIKGIKGDLSQKIKRTAADASQMTIEGRTLCSGGFAITQNNPCGIKVKIGVDEYKELIWEAAIPFSAIYGKDTLTKADAGRAISVCYAIKGFKKPKTNNSDNGSSGMGQGGGQGMGGGGRMGGGGGRGNKTPQRNGTDPRELMYENTRTWKFFGLAYQQ